jgi:hypothetical protein
MEQFDPKGINNSDQGRFRHKPFHVKSMRVEQAKQPGPLRQLGKQIAIIPRQPPVECPISRS